MSKTPVTILQEFCAQNQIVPKYELVINGVGSHNPFFRYRLIVATDLNTIETFGNGKSKKEAKHEAARSAIKELGIEPNMPENHYTETEETKEEIQSPYQDAIKENNVGKLATMCAELSLSDPSYNLIGEEGPPHAKSFTFECWVAQLKENASSRTKQQAKHLAADKMIARVKGIMCSETDEDKLHIRFTTKEEEEARKESLVQQDKLAKCTYIDKTIKPKNTYCNLGLSFNDVHTLDLVSICGFKEDFIALLKSYKGDGSLDAVEILSEHLKKCGTPFSYKMLPTKSDSVCSCQMDTNPYFTTLGSGKDEEKAKFNAANNMLLLFKLYV